MCRRNSRCSGCKYRWLSRFEYSVEFDVAVCSNRCAIFVSFRRCRHFLKFFEDSVSGGGPGENEFRGHAASP